MLKIPFNRSRAQIFQRLLLQALSSREASAACNDSLMFDKYWSWRLKTTKKGNCTLYIRAAQLCLGFHSVIKLHICHSSASPSVDALYQLMSTGTKSCSPTLTSRDLCAYEDKKSCSSIWNKTPGLYESISIYRNLKWNSNIIQNH